MTKHTHTLDVYGTRLALATTRAEWKALRRTHGWLSKKPDAMGLAWFNASTPPSLVLWVDVARHTSARELVDTISHEAVHGAHLILEHTGHRPVGIDEPYAYLTGWLAAWMYERTHGAQGLR